MPIIIQPMRGVNKTVFSQIIIKDALHPFEVMKDLRPKEKPKQLYFCCGAGGNPPPNDNDNINIFKRQFTPEEIAKIKEACKCNLLTKDYLSIMNYNKKF
jgi:hypothetical protein